MQLLLRLQAFLFSHTYLNFLGNALNLFLAQLMIHIKKIDKATTLEELGRNWQKGFATTKQVPITKIDEQTVFAEIHTPCPLRNTGDTLACFKMMSYDRQIVKKAGGQFIVLESQAEKGKTICKVAMRFQATKMNDLVAAHLQ
jgi:hypothetical protein